MSNRIIADVRYIVSENADISGKCLLEETKNVLLGLGFESPYSNHMDVGVPDEFNFNLLVEELYASEKGTVFLSSTALNPKRKPIISERGTKYLYGTLNYTSIERNLQESLDAALTELFSPRVIELLRADEYNLLL